MSPVMARPKEIPGDVIRLTVTLPVTTHKKLEREAKKQRKTIAAIMRAKLESDAA
jgi:hypothetical protein